MAVTATARTTANLVYTVRDAQADRSISESSNVGLPAITFENGTGVNQIDMGFSDNGNLPSGESVVYNISGLQKSLLGETIDINFTTRYDATFPPWNPMNRVRGIIVTNKWEHADGVTPADWPLVNYPYLTVVATGMKGFSGLFNGGSGGVKIMPQSSWMFTDSVGIWPRIKSAEGQADEVEIGLIDSGSGVPYEISIVGTTGAYYFDWS